MPIAQTVDRYFIENEEILKEWASKKWDSIYGTQHRVFFIKEGMFNKKFVEASYDHITSIEFSRVRPKERLIGSIACYSLALFLYIFFGYSMFRIGYYGGPGPVVLGPIIFLIFLGSVLLVLFIIGIRRFIIHINGRKPITVPFVERTRARVWSVASSGSVPILF